jgi:hypothetical protein
MIPVAEHEYHGVEMNGIVSAEIVSWLRLSFGPAGQRWFYQNHKIFFYDPKDHMMFLLRWAS